MQDKKTHFKKIVIAGVGLMGGSLGLAVKKAGLADSVWGWARRPVTLKQAKRIRCIDQGSLSPAAAAGADLVVLAGPVCSTSGMLKSMLPYLAPGCLITDLGSTKKQVLADVAAVFQQSGKKRLWPFFIGSHPMAGSEKAGVLASRSDLYQDSLCILVKTKKTDSAALRRLKYFWQAVGCRRVSLLSSEIHDRLTAAVSHLPHIAAVCLVNRLAADARRDPRLLDAVSSGFRDTTRIAAGPPVMWLDILLTNRQALIKALTRLQRELSGVRTMLASGNARGLYRLLEQASEFRQKLEILLPK
ncbi:prephenate dehydrogenase [candidate division FCPU426 bacterium]|nr:prephenate dehydrogenase [candidate division FCPU426 bacterium]